MLYLRGKVYVSIPPERPVEYPMKTPLTQMQQKVLDYVSEFARAHGQEVVPEVQTYRLLV